MSFQDRNLLLTEHFSQFISEHKKGFIERVLDQRTRYVTVVLEDIYQSHNASAVMRTCECLGIQNVNTVETSSQWSTNKKVLKGSDKWLDIIRYKSPEANNIADCFRDLKQHGYLIAVADPSPDGISIEEVSLDQPLAIAMGHELKGSSQFAMDHADLKVKIPMVGFTESLNISVSAAICLQSVLSRLRNSDIPWRLTGDEKDLLRLKWYKKVVRRAELMEREYLRSIQ